MLRGDYNWFHTNAQGRGSKDCAQADEWSEHPVLQQETRLLPQIPSGEIWKKIFLTRIFFSEHVAWVADHLSALRPRGEDEEDRPSSAAQWEANLHCSGGRQTVVSILKHDWFDTISKIDFPYVKNPSFPIKKHSSPLSDKNGNPWHCGDNLLLGELWSQQNKPRGNETQTCFSSFFSKWKF